ncbi:GGDEF domain-containing protein [Acinetobacter sp. 194]|uniref:GGDEF domain-containing protein n=1 Tax=Acinetobacter shaoyimingii TaxID=2715164 RepID=UPI001407B962|nr:GGDEF domain-containing protein [Acinetobacter shaoyimingii]NHB58178.1 GGDEF domain-containing protein [Acinetobacter shaoyimingii]
MENLDFRIFDLSPIPMWIQDYSGVKKIFDQWHLDGIEDIKAYILEQPSRLLPCLATIQTTRINRSTLKLYEANNLEEILANFAKFHFEEITLPQAHFFAGLWEKNDDCFFAPINYTCTGRQIDVQLRAHVIPGYEDTWEKILLTTEDITPYQHARRFAEAIFMHSPTALWVKDCHKIKQCFDQLRQKGITHLDAYIEQHPDFLRQCFELTVSKNVNEALLHLFKLKDQQDFDRHIQSLYAQNNYQNFYYELMHLWNGQHDLQRESEYTLKDDAVIFVVEQLNIFPDAVESWSTIQVAYTNLTERKELENHLKYLSQYDQLTQLHNRTFFNEEIVRLQTKKVQPFACIYMDLNGLKTLNDVQGHHHGDLLLKRFANILIDTIQHKPYSASRVGGDEFVILMPYATELDALSLLQEIENRIVLENSHDPRIMISVASGIAWTNEHENIENLIRTADQNMYIVKKNHYKIRPY